MPNPARAFAQAHCLSEEQVSAAELAGRIAAGYEAKSFGDRDAVRELWSKLVNAGFAGMSLPEKYGGAGSGLLELCLVMERTSAAGFPAAKLILSQGIVGPILLRSGSSEQCDRWLPPVAAGDIEFSFALTEADAGSNPSRMRTVAEPVGDGSWRLRGEKCYITAVDDSAAMLVAAQTPSADGLTLFIVEEPVQRLGLTRMNIDISLFESQFVVHFDDVVVGPDAIVGEPGNGLSALFHGLNPERLLTGSQAVGLGRWGLDRACRYANSRAVFAHLIGAHQAVQHPLAESWLQLEAAWGLMIAAARGYDRGEAVGVECNAAKVLACDAGWLALDRALQTYAGSGFVADHRLIERLMVARLFKIAPVTREMALNHIAAEGLGLPKSY
ncbi:acyl-CoA dehydrogenase family protein [Mycolicibacterium sphagni]|uniref:Acyl-CoA dehydrogenase n=1 Tax=Mycolicibacterium sphagni TaxID=1786 RepID=A0A255DG09_9MYCO|nr:acyl-CoA dehydrogenase family protein [Mycolicibacterium sphagni]OYN76165.1 hypothetical protein CG716_22710 [Mycolicibacterium sphagni]